MKFALMLLLVFPILWCFDFSVRLQKIENIKKGKIELFDISCKALLID